MNVVTRVVALTIASAVATSLAAGCVGVSSTENQNGTSSPSQSAVHTSDPTPVPEQSETIQVEVDRWVFGLGMTNEQILSNAKANGYTATLDANNDDGTIIAYTMTRKQQQLTLDTLRTSFRKAHAELVEDDSTSFTAVDTTDAMDEFEVQVDADLYRKSETSHEATFYREAALFQGIAGVAPEDVAWKLRYVDDDTRRVLYSRSYVGSYAQWLAKSDG